MSCDICRVTFASGVPYYTMEIKNNYGVLQDCLHVCERCMKSFGFIKEKKESKNA